MTALEKLIAATKAEQELREQLSRTWNLDPIQRKKLVQEAQLKTRMAQDEYNRERAVARAWERDSGISSKAYTGRLSSW